MDHNRIINLLVGQDRSLQDIADAIGYSSLDSLIGTLHELCGEGLIKTDGEMYSLTEAGEKYCDDRFYGTMPSTNKTIVSHVTRIPLTANEMERQYLLLVVAAAVRARLTDDNNLDYAIDRLERVVAQAEKAEQSDISRIAQGELDVARRVYAVVQERANDEQ